MTKRVVAIGAAILMCHVSVGSADTDSSTTPATPDDACMNCIDVRHNPPGGGETWKHKFALNGDTMHDCNGGTSDPLCHIGEKDESCADSGHAACTEQFPEGEFAGLTATDVFGAAKTAMATSDCGRVARILRESSRCRPGCRHGIT